MNAKMTAKSLVTALLLAVGSASFAEEVFLGRLEEVEETVPSGTETSSDSYFVDSESGWFSKLGAGGLVFPLSNVLSPAPLKIAHRNGTLRLTKGTPAAVVKPTLDDAPTVIREKAAFWVDSRTNLAYADESAGTVSDWYDVRETAADIAAGTTKYPSAHAVKLWAADIVYPKLAEDEEDGNRYINFNGIHSSTAMKFSNAGSMEPVGGVSSVKHIFTAHRMTTGIGVLWGVNSAVAPDSQSSFCFGNYKGDFANYLGLAKTYYGDYRAPNGRFWRDGVLFDPVNTAVGKRTEVLEFATMPMLTGVQVGNFFCDRGYYLEKYEKRCGGDDIGECIIFDVALTEEERLQVSEYMLKRWRSGLASGGVSVAVAKGAALEITGAADEINAKEIPLSSKTDIVKTGTGTATLQRQYTSKNIGNVRLEEGALSYESGDLTTKLEVGEKITATKDSWDTLALAKGASEAGTVEYAGDGRVNVTAIPAGTENMVVSGGSVVLGNKAEATAVEIPSGDDVWATIPNGGFEDGALADTGWSVSKSGDGEVTIQDYAAGSAWRRPYYNAADTVHYGAPEGTHTVFLRKHPFFIHGKITFPVAGVYNLSFYAAMRKDYQYMPSETDILLFREGETNVIARMKTRYENTTWQKYVFRLPRVEAGDYRIGFRNNTSTSSTIEQNIAIDALAAKLVPDADVNEILVPAGDFERETFPTWQSANQFNLRKQFGVTGWTLDNPGFGSVSETTPDVAVVSSRTSAGVYRESMSPTGDRQLLFTGHSGSAVSDLFAVPAGNYSVRFDVARIARCSFKSGDVSYLPYNQPNFEVAVFKNGEATAVATYTTGLVPSFLPVRFDNQAVSFDVAANDSLTVRIRQVNDESYTDSSSRRWLACGVIDNVRLVRQTASNARNLVKNPTFLSEPYAESDWTLDACKDANNDNATVFRSAVPRGNHYGYAVCDDDRALLICQCACIHQEVDVPAAGWYKLSCWTCSRADYGNDPTRLTYQYGGNQLKAWWCQADGTDTNEFYRSACIFSTNFLEQTAYVKLPQGKIRFGLQGVNRNGVEVVAPNKTDSNFFLDCISLTAVEAPTAPTELTGKTVTVAKGAKLRLDFDGQVKLESFGYGKGHKSGVINAERFPGFISGEGSFYVEPKGLSIIVR